MRSRPDITLELPERVAAGDFTIVVTLTSHSATPVNGVHLFVEEVSTLTYGPQSEAFLSGTRTLLHRELVAGGTELDEGTRSFEVLAHIPPTALESVKGPLHTRSYRARVEVDIPLWPDASAERAFVVAAPPGAAPLAPEPAVQTFPRIAGPLVLEVALADTRAAPGETLSGTLTFGSIGDFRFDGASVHLQLTEEIHERDRRGGMSERRWWHTQPARFVSLTSVVEGVPVPFSVTVPRDAQPSVPRQDLEIEDLRASSELRWLLVARVDNTAGAHGIPVHIGRWPPRRAAQEHTLVSGRDRWHQAWSDLARAHGLASSEDTFELRGDLHGASAMVVEAQDGERGVKATLCWDRGDFGVEVRKRRLLHAGDIRFHDDLPFDVFAVDARMPERARALLTPELREALVAATRVGSVEISNTMLTLHAPIAAQESSQLEALLSALDALARSIADALDAMPPPPGAEGLVEAWRGFAERRGATFFAGSMRLLRIHVDDVELSLQSVLDEHSTIVASVLAVQVDRDDAHDARGTPEVQKQIHLLERDARKVSFHGGRVQLRMPGLVPDPEALESTFADLLALRRLLRNERAPRGYR